MSYTPHRDVDEKGNTLKSPVDYFRQCPWCGLAFGCRREGRPPTYCSAECRRAHKAAKLAVDNARANLKVAQANLRHAERHLRSHGGNNAVDD